jgi:hypothetical protein
VNLTGAFSSTVIVSGSPAWADNEQLMQVTVTLFDECGDSLADSRAVNITSSRPVTDTIAAGAIVSNQYFFNVRSSQVGASIFTATTRLEPTSVVTNTTISFPVSGPPSGNFVCLAGTPDISTNPNTLQIRYTHPGMPPNRRLVYTKIERLSGAGPQLSTISFGNASNRIYNPGTPLDLTVEVLPTQWTGINRLVVAGTLRQLQFNFVAPVTGPATYRINAGWDDGNGASRCDSAPVDVIYP